MNDLYKTGLSFLSNEWQSFADLKEGLVDATGYDDPFHLLKSLVCDGLSEHKVIDIKNESGMVRSSKSYFKLKEKENGKC